MPLVDLAALQGMGAEQEPNGNQAEAFATLCRPVDGLLAKADPSGILEAARAGKDVHFVTGGRWSLHDVLLLALPEFGPSSLTFCTYSITEFPARILAGALDDGRLTSLHVLLDVRAKAQYQSVYQLVSNVATKLRLASVHAKAFVLDNGNDILCVMGSANWTNNPRLEAGLVTMHRPAAEFHRNWILKAMDYGHPFNC